LGLAPLLRRIAVLEASSRAVSDWLALAALYAEAERLDPGDHRLPANRGNVLWLADCPQQALRAYWHASTLRPGDPVVLLGLGNVHLDQNAFELAERAYRRSLDLDPAARTAWNLSQLLIGMERFAEGYALAEFRWGMAEHSPWRDPSCGWASSPDQLREPLLLWSEQGLGDTLQHLRWLSPLLAWRGSAAGPLVLEVEPNLVQLLQAALVPRSALLEVRAKPAEGPRPWSGRHLSLLSLPWLLGGAPCPQGASWLSSSAWRSEAPWPVRQPRVGLVWAAGRKLEDPVTAREYHRRSLNTTALGQLIEGLDRRGAEVVPLQFGVDLDQAAPWRPLMAEGPPADADFAVTAAAVADLDLVITVDTAMAHLVGAMRRRGWLLLPHAAAPRWLRHRQDSPWYPSLRLFRQPCTGDWSGLVEQVLQQLDRELGEGPQPPA